MRLQKMRVLVLLLPAMFFLAAGQASATFTNTTELFLEDWEHLPIGDLAAGTDAWVRVGSAGTTQVVTGNIGGVGDKVIQIGPGASEYDARIAFGPPWSPDYAVQLEPGPGTLWRMSFDISFLTGPTGDECFFAFGQAEDAKAYANIRSTSDVLNLDQGDGARVALIPAIVADTPYHIDLDIDMDDRRVEGAATDGTDTWTAGVNLRNPGETYDPYIALIPTMVFTANGTTTSFLLDNITAVAIVRTPGDANGDGQVTDADAAILATHWQQTGMSWSDGDFNNDGQVTDADAAILATHWQEGVTEAAPVPEPSALVLMAIGVAIVLACGRGLPGNRVSFE